MVDGPVDTLLLCVWYLRAKEREAEGFSLAIEGALSCLGITVILQFEPLDMVYLTDVFANFLDANQVDGASLFVCIVTEGSSSEGGGLWWIEDEVNQYHETLDNLYRLCFHGTEESLISRFHRRAVLQLACGVGLDAMGVQDLNKWTNRDVIDDLIAPTNLAFHPAQVTGCVVSLAVLMYYQGRSLESSLPEAWLRDERARQHTDFLLLRSGHEPSALVWSPRNRPFGRDLEFCPCEHRVKGRWHHKKTKMIVKFQTEHLYQCRGCNAFLRALITRPDDFDLIDTCDTQYVVCSWPIREISMSTEFLPSRQATM
ncbi:hypothetical protein RSAG8_06634, partial [Rhizoctonia solani AG-8 WAC10335]